MTSFTPFEATALATEDLRLAAYGLDMGPDSPIDRLLFGANWVKPNGFYDQPSKRVHLMYLHLFGNSGHTVRNAVAGITRSDAYSELLAFDWGEVGLDRAIEMTLAEHVWRQEALADRVPSGRMPLFRGVHCLSPFEEAGERSELQHWTQEVVEKGCSDGTLEMDIQSGEPTGFVRDVPVFTNTIDSWTPSLRAARYWSRSTVPGNEFCTVMAVEAAHEEVVFWRNDGGADEVVVRGSSGTANVYFQEQIRTKATEAELASFET